MSGEAQVLEDAIVTVDEQRTQRKNFGREVKLDLSTRAKEIEAFHFPCNQILDSSQWEYALVQPDREKFTRFMEFRQKVLEPFRNYALPVISLKKETSKEAVCLVFEKVNTGGVPLSVFELIAATWAADGFSLRDDWFGGRGKSGRHGRLSKKPLLRDLQPTDFLQGVSLLHSFEKRTQDLAAGRVGKEATGVSAKREHILEIRPLAARGCLRLLLEGPHGRSRPRRREARHPPHLPDEVVRGARHPSAKTAISYKANRMVGGSAPSKYLAQLQTHAQVKLDDTAMDTILKSHVIDPALLRADSFHEFYAARKAALLAIVERAMGKASAEGSAIVADDDDEDEEEGEAA